jgi:hypothetical protein
MNSIIVSNDFKAILSEIEKDDKTKTNAIFQKSNAPKIKIKIENDNIIIGGDFELKDDLVFDKQDEYDLPIIIDGGTFKNITFIGGRYRKIIFRRGEFNGYVSIRGGYFGNIILLGGNFKHWLGTLKGANNFLSIGNKLTELAEENLDIVRFEIDGGTYAHNIWLSGGNINRLEIKCVTPVKIHCHPSDDKQFNSDSETYEYLYNSVPKIEEIVISRYLSKDTFYHFSELEIKNLSFENCTNLGNITFSGNKITNELKLENSDIGKTTFINCKFSKDILIFKNSKITEMSLAGTILPKMNNKKTDIENIEQIKLAMSQIKKVYQNMGDNGNASYYKAEELKSLLQHPKFKWDKINLWLNQFSNKFEVSWERAFAILLLGNLILYGLYCRSLNFNMNYSKEGVKLMFQNLSYIFEFINPIRKLSTISEILIPDYDKSLSSTTILIDSLSKLFNAYIIYQFISAFRRHGKSSN